MPQPIFKKFCCCCDLSTGNTIYAYFQFFVSLISIGIGIMKFMTTKAEQKSDGYFFDVPDELKPLFASGPLFNLSRILIGFISAAIFLIFIEGIKKEEASKMVAYLFFKTINLFFYFIYMLHLASLSYMMLIATTILLIEVYLFFCAYSIYLQFVKPDDGSDSEVDF
ncbi:unnamed protein product [Chironomus riparius]|uniref:Uncharacterized protein n=1 Tax=Chironomus riparius TaxID=315576 RepID=A0A9N9S3G3_9DIPT|nr:unnamed protein product [Chironomus riparius]